MSIFPYMFNFFSSLSQPQSSFFLLEIRPEYRPEKQQPTRGVPPPTKEMERGRETSQADNKNALLLFVRGKSEIKCFRGEGAQQVQNKS